MNKSTRPCRCCDGSGTELDPNAIGGTMRKLRRRNMKSLLHVASRMGFTVGYVSDLERGHRNWNPDLMDRFREACQ